MEWFHQITWITRSLGWKFGNGSSIRIGIDHVACLNSSFVLPMDLRGYLEDYGITSLVHARNIGTGASSQSYWLTVEDLELGGCWKDLWTDYISGLSHGCIRLVEKNDSPSWM